MTMNTKLMIAAGAIALAFASQFPAIIISPAMAGEPSICAMARNAIAAQRPTAVALAERCAAAGGNAYGPPPKVLGRVVLPPVQLPPQPAPAPAIPAPQPSDPYVIADPSYDDGISCDEGRSIVRHLGFRKVH